LQPCRKQLAWPVCLRGCLLLACPPAVFACPVNLLLAKAILTQASAEDHPLLVDATFCTPRGTLLGGGIAAIVCVGARLWCKLLA